MKSTSGLKTEYERNIGSETAALLNEITHKIVDDTYSNVTDSKVPMTSSHSIDEAISDSSHENFCVHSSLPSSRQSVDELETLHLSPVVSAENALQLHFGPVTNESMQISNMSGDVPIIPVYSARSDKNESVTHLGYTAPVPDIETDIPTGAQSLRVRFRSRVRIGSGIRKHASGRHSAGSSPSSSISVPLRYQADGDGSGSSHREDDGNMPIPYDDTFDAATAHLLQRHMMSPRVRRKRTRHSWNTDERSPLMSHASRHPSYVRSQVESDDEGSNDVQYQIAARRFQEDIIFGEWPGRLLNRHWWWWKINPVLCYCCNETDDETDDEEL